MTRPKLPAAPPSASRDAVLKADAVPLRFSSGPQARGSHRGRMSRGLPELKKVAEFFAGRRPMGAGHRTNDSGGLRFRMRLRLNSAS
jgi:hypothetical protein